MESCYFRWLQVTASLANVAVVIRWRITVCHHVVLLVIWLFPLCEQILTKTTYIAGWGGFALSNIPFGLLKQAFWQAQTVGFALQYRA